MLTTLAATTLEQSLAISSRMAHAHQDHEDVKSGIEAVKNHHREAREVSSHKCTVKQY